MNNTETLPSPAINIEQLLYNTNIDESILMHIEYSDFIVEIFKILGKPRNTTTVTTTFPNNDDMVGTMLRRQIDDISISLDSSSELLPTFSNPTLKAYVSLIATYDGTAATSNTIGNNTDTQPQNYVCISKSLIPVTSIRQQNHSVHYTFQRLPPPTVDLNSRATTQQVIQNEIDTQKILILLKNFIHKLGLAYKSYTREFCDSIDVDDRTELLMARSQLSCLSGHLNCFLYQQCYHTGCETKVFAFELGFLRNGKVNVGLHLGYQNLDANQSFELPLQLSFNAVELGIHVSVVEDYIVLLGNQNL